MFKNTRPVVSRASFVTVSNAPDTTRNGDDAPARVDSDSRPSLILNELSRMPSPPLLLSNLGSQRDVDTGVRLAGGPRHARDNESELLPPGYASAFGRSHF
jgi:hypothetical protein